MDRYSSYSQTDSLPIIVGDTEFNGVDLYNSAENLEPGMVQAATNIDFSSRDAATRGGFVCIPELGTTQFNSMWIASASVLNDSWTGVCYGNGIYVGVSSNNAGNQVAISSDGITWFGQTAANTNSWNAICYGGGLFVAVATSGAGNRVMTSSDGISWSARTSANDYNWNSVVYGGGVFVACATDSVTSHFMSSPDGVTWTARNGSSAVGRNSVTFGNGTFVAVGNNVAEYSTDGLSWTAATISSQFWVSVAYGNGKFVTINTDVGAQPVSYSPDGITWTAVTTTLGVAASRKQVAFGNGAFIVINTAQAFSSSDTIHWSSQTIANGASWSCIAYGPNGFVTLSSISLGSVYAAYLPNVRVFASGRYSDPNSTGTPWVVLVGRTAAGFYSFGQTSRSVSFPSGYVISAQSCVVQANNLLFIFSGFSQAPIQWDGSWGGAFVACPVSTLGVGYEDIPPSNAATYYQNRLWVVKNKDTIIASQALDFKNFNTLAGVFNINVGTSDYLTCSYPFGNNSLVVFENRSSYLLQAVNSSALGSVTSTEITRQLGIVGVNAVTAVGPDLVYVSSDRNVTSIRLNIQNATQAITVPLSQDINPIMSRVNWTYGSKISVGYWNNLLFVALPLDNAIVCNTVLVYNFITNKWFGEWNFSDSINIAIQGFVTANYLGRIRIHCVTEDGRIFVTNEGPNDISGATVAEIETSMTTRAYVGDNNSKIGRRMWVDLSTNRPDFSIEAFAEPAADSIEIITDQTYLRSQSWRFNDSTYAMTNVNDDYNRAWRKDYAGYPVDNIQAMSGFLPEMTQNYRLPVIQRLKGRLCWLSLVNTTGFCKINSIGQESRSGDRSSLVQVG